MGLTNKNKKQHNPHHPTSFHIFTGVCFKMLYFVMEYSFRKHKHKFEALTASYVQRSKILTALQLNRK